MSASRRKSVKSDCVPTSTIRDQAAYARAVARNAAIKNSRAIVNVPMSVMGGNYLSNRPADFRSSSAEVKSVDLPVAPYLISIPAIIVPLNLISSGSSFFNRVGRRIEMKNIRVVCTIFFNPPVAVNTLFPSFYVRFLIVYDRQTNGSIPSINEILQTTDQSGVNSTTAFSGVNLNNRDRFSILRDTRISIPQVTSSATGNVSLGATFTDPLKPLSNLDHFVKLKGLVTQYKADTNPSVIGDIATGGLFWIMHTTAGASPWACEMEARLRYHDKS